MSPRIDEPNLVVTRQLPGRPSPGTPYSSASSSFTATRRSSVSRVEVPRSATLKDVRPVGGGRRASLSGRAGPSSSQVNTGKIEEKSLIDQLGVGSVVQFHETSTKKRLGKCIRDEGRRRWLVIDSHGRDYVVPSWKMTYVLANGREGFKVGQNLRGIEKAARSKAKEGRVTLEGTWRKLTGSSAVNGIKVKDFEYLVFGSASPETNYASHLILSEENTFFVRKKVKTKRHFGDLEEYIPKSAREVGKSFEENADKERWRNIRKSVKEQSTEYLDTVFSHGELDKLIKGLELIAADMHEQDCDDDQYVSNFNNSFNQLHVNTQSMVCEIMGALNFQICPSSAFELLVAWKIFTRHENIPLRKAGLHNWRGSDYNLSEKVEDIMNHDIKDLDKGDRTDMSQYEAVSIDNPSTTDVEDAISWDRDQKRILVHISDPTRYFPDGLHNPIISEALKRGESLYLPYTRLAMFPKRLSTDRFSLSGKYFDGSSLTFSFQIMSDGSIGRSMGVEPTIIKRPRRLTYKNAQKSILKRANSQTDEDLKTLYDLALKRRDYREARNNGLFRRKRQTEVQVKHENSDNPEISIQVRDDCEAKVLVSEMMITANTVAAKVARHMKVPFVYRKQKGSTQPKSVGIGSSVGHFSESMHEGGKPEYSTTPGPHSFLGLSEYSTVTSPLRRFVDLVSHFQLKAALRGDPTPNSETRIRGILRDLKSTIDVHRSVEARTKRYWQYEFLRRQEPDALYYGTYSKPRSGARGVLHMTDIGLDVEADLSNDSLDDDTSVVMRIKKVNPRQESIFFDRIDPRPHKKRKASHGGHDLEKLTGALDISANAKTSFSKPPSSKRTK